ncbi:MAG: SGNH/GDSL hydrolase family protein, partial [Deltaproteobacteria bacterium]|nr:SGNH/GDSL hydrolase family protein [Deltaproteobacteria bacterium]
MNNKLKYFSKTFLWALFFVIAGQLSACTDESALTDETSSTDNTDSDTSIKIPGNPSIIAIGDSIMAWNSLDTNTIPDVVADSLGTESYNGAIPGSTFLESIDSNLKKIPDQYIDDDWKWLIMDGGANDLNDRCGCGKCDDVLDTLLSDDGKTGAIPDFVKEITDKNIKVAVMGYYHVPASAMYGFADCNDWVDKFNERLKTLSDNLQNVWMVDTTLIIDPD